MIVSMLIVNHVLLNSHIVSLVMLMNVLNVNHTEEDNSVHVSMDILKLSKKTSQFVSIVLTNVKLAPVLLITVLSVKKTKDLTHHSVTAQMDIMMMVLKMSIVIFVTINVPLVLNSVTTVPLVKLTELMFQNVNVNLVCSNKETLV
jgi:hypothetical protein